VRADFQTSGKGHHGNQWQSEPGMNLLFSILLKPKFLAIENAFHLSRISSLSVIDVLDNLDVSSKIKWPNDILIGKRKVCGILIENCMQGEKILHTVIGIGLNINQDAFSPLMPAATSLVLEKGCHYDMHILLEHFRDTLESWYQVLSNGHTERITGAYMNRLYRLNEPAMYSDGSGEFMARITDVLPGGELELSKEGGGSQRYGFKEIEYLE